MTLTPDRRRDERRARRQRRARGSRVFGVGESGCDPLTKLIPEVASTEPGEVPRVEGVGAAPGPAGADGGEPLTEEPDASRAFPAWFAPGDDPAAQSEVKRRIAQLNAEQEAWMRQKRDEAERAEAAAASPPSCGGGETERSYWGAQRRQSDEAAAYEQNALIERQRGVLGGLGPGPANGEVGKGFASALPNRGNRDRTSGSGIVHDDGFALVRSPGAESAGRDAGDAAVAVPAEKTDTAASIHPLLSGEEWSDLGRLAPEMTGSIENLRTLVDELESFARPMGPDDAVTMLDGIETLNRLAEALSVVTLSVFERVGSPRDYGAKSTRSLVKNRLGVSGREASRRVDLAERLGKRVTVSGESLDPVNPAVAAGLRTGRLSSVQASVITRCLDGLPRRVTEAERLEAERILVEKAPLVHVKDIGVLFDEILKWLDPDGELPDDSTPREDFSVNLRARRDGTWDLRGRLDSVTGGIMHGLLTSRMQADEHAGQGGPAAPSEPGRDDGPSHAGAFPKDGVTSNDGASSNDGGSVDDGTVPNRHGSAADGTPLTANEPGGPDHASEETVDETVRLFEEVLRGDRCDAIDPSPTLGSLTGPSDTSVGSQIPAGYGVREDGTPVPMASEQPSVRRRIYERFSTIIGRIELDRVGAGAPFALVVTASAEDLAKGEGRARTGAAENFPLARAAREGLNGAVFFHLMSERGRTVSVQTENRYANRNQLTILAARDQGCTFPGCETPPGWCDAHHIVPWSEGGKTDINNLTLACSAHHHLIDRTDWHAIMLCDGRPAWVPPPTIDPERRPILHSRFIAREIADTLFD